MAHGKYLRSWWHGAAALSLMAAGCVQPSGNAPGGTLWSRASPPSADRSAASDAKPTPRLHLAYAKWQEQTGNTAEARKSYETVLHDDPRSVDALLGLARLEHLAGRESQSEQHYRAALKLRPNHAPTLDALGQFYASQQRWPEAIEMQTAAINLAPEHSRYRYHLAVSLARSGDVNAALPHFARSVGDAEAHYNAGYILYEQGELAGAEQQFLQAVVKKPELTQAQSLLDEIRRGREEGQMIASSPPAAARTDAPPADGPGHTWTAQPAARQSVQQAAADPFPTWPPAETPLETRPAAHETARPQTPADPQAAPAPAPAARVSPEPESDEFVLPAGLSRQQIEQWQNQQRQLGIQPSP